MANLVAKRIVGQDSIPVTFVDNGDGTFSEQVGAAVTATVNITSGADASAANQVITNTEIGATNETAPASDTASSGLNGRLQRVAQRLTTLIGQIPATLGQKTMANSLSVAVASDQGALPVSATQLPAALGQTNMSGSMSVVLASNQTALDTTNVTQLPAALGQTTMSASLPVAIASDQGNLAISTQSTLLTFTPTITTGAAYTAGYAVGGVGTLTNAVRVNGGTGLLKDLVVIDRSNQKAPVDVLIFGRNPSNGTYTDKTAITLNATDATYLIGKVSVAASDYVTVGGVAVASVSVSLVLKEATGSARNLYTLIATEGTPTYASAGDVVVKFGIAQD